MVNRVNGSPPRGWGKRDTLSSHQCNNTVHPHAGGENKMEDYITQMTDGSPPRGWGKRESIEEHKAKLRFTPTRVGKTR